MLPKWPCISNFPSTSKSLRSWKKALRPGGQQSLFSSCALWMSNPFLLLQGGPYSPSNNLGIEVQERLWTHHKAHCQGGIHPTWTLQKPLCGDWKKALWDLELLNIFSMVHSLLTCPRRCFRVYRYEGGGARKRASSTQGKGPKSFWVTATRFPKLTASPIHQE